MHHNLGRVTMLSAWVTIYLGVYMAHGSPAYKSSYAAWLVPIAVVMGTMVVVDVLLSCKRQRLAADSPTPPLNPYSRREGSSDAEKHPCGRVKQRGTAAVFNIA
jgi:hypothetical protein